MSRIVNDVTQAEPGAGVGGRDPDQSWRKSRKRCGAPTGRSRSAAATSAWAGRRQARAACTSTCGGINQVLQFSPRAATIRVQAGMRWCDIQRFVDPHDLAVKIMQTYANFTVGGSLSVNVPWPLRRPGTADPLGAQRSSWCSPSGDVVDASPTENAEIFYGAIGGYGGARRHRRGRARARREHARRASCRGSSPRRTTPPTSADRCATTEQAVFHNARPLRAALPDGALVHLGRRRTSRSRRRIACSPHRRRIRSRATSCGRSRRRRSASGGASI